MHTGISVNLGKLYRVLGCLLLKDDHQVEGLSVLVCLCHKCRALLISLRSLAPLLSVSWLIPLGLSRM
jgi:hypothetical protein